jgi:hypothetical protein
MTEKPEIRIDPFDGGSPLPAQSHLSALKESSSYHTTKDCRHPLGIYNISIVRICEKVSKCADRLELFWRNQPNNHADIDEIIDYLELSLYSAAEHTDDIKEIANSFFKNKEEALKNRNLRLLNEAIKPLRDEIASFTNTIKHNHGRIRLFETTFEHDAQDPLKLLGFFIEGFKDGASSPNPILHSNGKNIISITSFLWGILTFLALSSLELSKFLQRIKAIDESKEATNDLKIFYDTVVKLTRLPLYTFDEDHPFSRAKWDIIMNEEMSQKSDSGIYGSIRNKWIKSEAGVFKDYQLRYAGDGVTKSFNLALPKKMATSHWE